MAGAAVHVSVDSLLLYASDNAAPTIVNGRVVVREGQLAGEVTHRTYRPYP